VADPVGGEGAQPAVVEPDRDGDVEHRLGVAEPLDHLRLDPAGLGGTVEVAEGVDEHVVRTSVVGHRRTLAPGRGGETRRVRARRWPSGG
jgi:hypothetical protein